MGRLGRRLLHLVVVLFVVTFVTFALLNLLPGDVSLAILGNGATPEGVARVRLELGMNDPLWLRYVHWLAQTIQPKSGCSSLSPRSYEVVFQSLGASIRVHAAAIRRGGARS